MVLWINCMKFITRDSIISQEDKAITYTYVFLGEINYEIICITVFFHCYFQASRLSNRVTQFNNVILHTSTTCADRVHVTQIQEGFFNSISNKVARNILRG